MRCDPSPEDIIKAYEKIIKDNIEYDVLLQANKFDEELIFHRCQGLSDSSE